MRGHSDRFREFPEPFREHCRGTRSLDLLPLLHTPFTLLGFALTGWICSDGSESRIRRFSLNVGYMLLYLLYFKEQQMCFIELPPLFLKKNVIVDKRTLCIAKVLRIL